MICKHAANYQRQYVIDETGLPDAAPQSQRVFEQWINDRTLGEMEKPAESEPILKVLYRTAEQITQSTLNFVAANTVYPKFLVLNKIKHEITILLKEHLLWPWLRQA